MPNWCENRTTVAGDTATVKKFMDDFGGGIGKYRFANIVPLPTKSPDTDTNPFVSMLDVVNVWGTKWDLSDDDIEIIHNIEDNGIAHIEMDYLTAWSPPLEFWVKVAEKYPTLEIESLYIEPGIGYYGQFIARNGHGQDVERSFDDIGEEYYEMSTGYLFEELFPIE